MSCYAEGRPALHHLPQTECAVGDAHDEDCEMTMTDAERDELHDLAVSALRNIARTYYGGDAAPNEAVLWLFAKLLDRTPEGVLRAMEGVIQRDGVTLFERFEAGRYDVPEPRGTRIPIADSSVSDELLAAMRDFSSKSGAANAVVERWQKSAPQAGAERSSATYQ